MTKKEESDKGEDKGTRVWMPNEVKKQLEDLKIHPRQATHEIISQLLDKYKMHK